MTAEAAMPHQSGAYDAASQSCVTLIGYQHLSWHDTGIATISLKSNLVSEKLTPETLHDDLDRILGKDVGAPS